MDEYTISPSPLRVAETHSRQRNPVRNLGYGRLIAWNDFEGTSHTNDTSGVSLFTLCGGASVTGVIPPAVFSTNASELAFPSEYFHSGSRLKLVFHGTFTSLVAGTELAFSVQCSTTSLTDSLTLFKLITPSMDDEWSQWTFETNFSFLHGSSTDLAARSVTGYGHVLLRTTASPETGVIFPTSPDLTDPSETFTTGIRLFPDFVFDTASASNTISGLGFEVIQFS